MTFHAEPLGANQKRVLRQLGPLATDYQRKFAVEDIAHVLYGLAYFDDAEQERMPTMHWKVDWRTIKRTIQEWVREAAR